MCAYACERERHVEHERQQRAERDRAGSRGPGSGRRSRRRRSSRTRARAPSGDARSRRASSAAFTSASASVFSSRGTCCRSTIVVAGEQLARLGVERLAGSRASPSTRRVSCLITSIESARTCTIARAQVRDRLEPGDQRPVLGDVVGRHADALAHRREQLGRIGRGVEHDRADRRRPGIAARSAVAVQEQLVDRARLVGERQRRLASRDEDRAAVVAVRDLTRRRPRRICSASVDGIDRWHAGTSCRRAGPRPRPCSAPGGVRSRRAATPARSPRPAAHAVVFFGELVVDLDFGGRDDRAQPLDLGRQPRRRRRRAPRARRRASRALPSPRAPGLRGRSADAAACRCRPASPGARAASSCEPE